MSIQDNTILFY